VVVKKQNMVSCRICQTYINEDHRRKYCDKHREYRGGEWRQKHYIKNFNWKNKHKYAMRQTKVTGTGFSEHMKTSKKTGEPLFKLERIAVRKERRRIGI
jgi:hypothetical protein